MSDNENRTINFSDNFNEEKKNKEIKKFLNILKQSFNNFVNSNENKLKNLNCDFNITKNNTDKYKYKNKKKLFHIETDYVSINCEDYNQSFFCLINAPWGSGKTYFIEQLASFINKENNNNEIFIKFDLLDICNPEYNVNEVIYKIFKTLYSKSPFSKISKKIRKIENTVIFLKCLKFFPIFSKLIDWKGIMDYFIKKLTQVSLDKGIDFFNGQNEKLCILVLDNIERIGTNWYDIFRGIKRFLKFNNFIFIIPVDIKNLYISNSISEQTELFIKKFINIRFDFNQDIKSMIINNLSEFHPNDEKIDFIYEMFSPNSYERDKRKFNQLLSENKSYFKEIINISQNSIEIIEKIICGWEENKIKFNFDHFISIHEVIKKILLNTYEGIFKDLKVENKYNKFIIFFKNNFSSIIRFLKDVILFDKNIIKEKLSKNNFLIILFFLLSLNSANISKNYLYKEIDHDENLIVIIFLIAFSEIIILNYEKCINRYINNENTSIFCEFYEKIKEFDNFIKDFIEKNILILNKINFEIEIDFYLDIRVFLNNSYYYGCSDFLKNFFSLIVNVSNMKKNKLILEDKILYKIINYCKNKINNN